MANKSSKKPASVARGPDDPEQSKRFIEAARELSTDETGKAFERAFKRVALTRRQARRKIPPAD